MGFTAGLVVKLLCSLTVGSLFSPIAFCSCSWWRRRRRRNRVGLAVWFWCSTSPARWSCSSRSLPSLVWSPRLRGECPLVVWAVLLWAVFLPGVLGSGWAVGLVVVGFGVVRLWLVDLAVLHVLLVSL